SRARSATEPACRTRLIIHTWGPRHGPCSSSEGGDAPLGLPPAKRSIAGSPRPSNGLRLRTATRPGGAVALVVYRDFGPLARPGGWTRARVDALVVASRGVWLPRERRALRRRLSGLARRVNVIADVEAAWHATLGAERGVLVVAGTGSIALGRDARGRWARAGGLGPLLGDEGSAFWIGREWLRATADERARRRFATAPQPVSTVAALAPRVVARARRGHRVAGRIVSAAQAHLAAQASAVARALRLPPPVVVGGAGSVMGDRWFAAGVRSALARAGVRAH